MTILRSSLDFPQKIEEMKLMYPSKAIAMEQIDLALDYLRKVKHYRQYTESDDMFEMQAVLHLKLKAYLVDVPDWCEKTEPKFSTFSKVLTFISHWPVDLLYWTTRTFPKEFTKIRKSILIKRAELKKKNLI